MDICGFAFVSGAGSGLGKACALAYAKEGVAGLVCADIELSAAEVVAQEARRTAVHTKFRAIALYVDVTQEASVDQAIQTIMQHFGRMDYAVNCAGVGVQKDREIADADVSEFDRFLNVNARGVFLMTRAQSRVMKTQEPRLISEQNPRRGNSRGVIINMASAASLIASPRMVQYTTSKHAVLGLTRNAALDNATHGIRVNCLCPSWIDTPMVQRAIEGVPTLRAWIENAVPLGRIGEPDEVADVVMFLSSYRSSYVTGVGFIVDGGTTLTTKT